MKQFTRHGWTKAGEKDFFVVFHENCQGGFRGTGLFPFNPNAIPESAFAPSNTTERAPPCCR